MGAVPIGGVGIDFVRQSAGTFHGSKDRMVST